MVGTGTTIKELVNQVMKIWAMEDLGLAESVDGMEVTCVYTHQYALHQNAMTKVVLPRFSTIWWIVSGFHTTPWQFEGS